MKLLITADLHLTDRDRDAYRFGIFVWLVRRAEEHNVKNVFILGDLTEFKDRHAAALVNRMTYELAYLQRHRNVHILMGNHDFVDPTMPFFKFMNMKTDSRRLELVFGPCVMLPYQASQEAFDAHCGLIKEGDGVFCHQLFTGAVSETGARLSGIDTTALEARKPKWVFAGDIHRPQTVGPVIYTGSPYQTRFGDDYAPRVVLFDTETLELTNLYYPSPRKITLHITDVLQSETWGAKKGDHVKVIWNLPPEEVTSWVTKKAEIREVCKAQGLEVFGIELEVTSSPERISLKDPEAKTDEGIFESFCLANGIMAKTKDAGLALLKD